MFDNKSVKLALSLLTVLLLQPRAVAEIKPDPGYRDPFSFGAVKKTGRLPGGRSVSALETTLKFQGFFKMDGKYAAFINNQIVERGEKIMGWVVKSISENKVVLVKNGREKVLKL